jgi:hypothetical protein
MDMTRCIGGGDPTPEVSGDPVTRSVVCEDVADMPACCRQGRRITRQSVVQRRQKGLNAFRIRC